MLQPKSKYQNFVAECPAYAKINTYLEVLSKRADGYHELCSHMQLITLHDTLVLHAAEAAPDGEVQLSLDCDRREVPVGEDNLILRAARAYLAAVPSFPRGLALHFSLQKRIPMQGGLAGGSADAAAALLLLNRLAQDALREEQLCALGATLGADVPFCIRGRQGAQTARGIGEIMTAAAGLSPQLTLLVVLPGTAVSTPAAFALLDAETADPMGDTRLQQNEQRYAAHLQSLSDGSLPSLAKTSFNRFERAVFSLQPRVETVFRLVKSLGADVTRMSGSGPTVIGCFADVERATAAKAVLLEQGYAAELCHPLDPDHCG